MALAGNKGCGLGTHSLSSAAGQRSQQAKHAANSRSHHALGKQAMKQGHIRPLLHHLPLGQRPKARQRTQREAAALSHRLLKSGTPSQLLFQDCPSKVPPKKVSAKGTTRPLLHT